MFLLKKEERMFFFNVMWIGKFYVYFLEKLKLSWILGALLSWLEAWLRCSFPWAAAELAAAAWLVEILRALLNLVLRRGDLSRACFSSCLYSFPSVSIFCITNSFSSLVLPVVDVVGLSFRYLPNMWM